jgi:hypothetical protein
VLPLLCLLAGPGAPPNGAVYARVAQGTNAAVHDHSLLLERNR